jgi:hypothetical protein
MGPVLLLVLAARLAAQGSPFIPLDHPLLPLAEYLIARGDIADPSPMIRPFRRTDLVRAIEAAHLAPESKSGTIAAALERAFGDRPDESWFRVAGRAGAQGYTTARRDLLHPSGNGAVTGYADLTLEGRTGSFVAVSRAAAENRLKDDPDWSGGSLQQRKSQAYRFIDGYLSAQWKHVRLFYGQMDRNWGPAGSLGLSLANYAYPRADVGLDLVFDRLQFNVVGTQVSDMTSIDGTTNKRYFMAHRLNVKVTKRLDLALWETGLLAGANQSFDPAFRNPMVLWLFPIQFGESDNRNSILGGDLRWRLGRVLLEGQAMIDDRWRNHADPSGTGEPAHPGRWGITVVGSGPLGSGALWRVGASAISSLAYRTIDSAQSFLDRGVGIGPHFTDNYTVTASVAVPVAHRFVITPDLTLLRQGEGRIDAPFPAGQQFTDTPEILIGTAATTYRVGTRVVGRIRGFDLAGDLGLNHLTNADNVPGLTRTRVEARIQATFGFSVGGPLR